jgi:hypothetical protein
MCLERDRHEKGNLVDEHDVHRNHYHLISVHDGRWDAGVCRANGLTASSDGYP